MNPVEVTGLVIVGLGILMVVFGSGLSFGEKKGKRLAMGRSISLVDLPKGQYKVIHRSEKYLIVKGVNGNDSDIFLIQTKMIGKTVVEFSWDKDIEVTAELVSQTV